MKGTTTITRTERQAKLPTRIDADKVIYPNDAAGKRTVRYNQTASSVFSSSHPTTPFIDPMPGNLGE